MVCSSSIHPRAAAWVGNSSSTTVENFHQSSSDSPSRRACQILLSASCHMMAFNYWSTRHRKRQVGGDMTGTRRGYSLVPYRRRRLQPLQIRPRHRRRRHRRWRHPPRRARPRPPRGPGGTGSARPTAPQWAPPPRARQKKLKTSRGGISSVILSSLLSLHSFRSPPPLILSILFPLSYLSSLLSPLSSL